MMLGAFVLPDTNVGMIVDAIDEIGIAALADESIELTRERAASLLDAACALRRLIIEWCTAVLGRCRERGAAAPARGPESGVRGDSGRGHDAGRRAD